ncbi:MAG: endolytic transglycosylase MltG, partial [Clostridia bacterium]|nr:endolytic transglycosylase MltG [Clostridia bacterium]
AQNAAQTPPRAAAPQNAAYGPAAQSPTRAAAAQSPTRASAAPQNPAHAAAAHGSPAENPAAQPVRESAAAPISAAETGGARELVRTGAQPAQKPVEQRRAEPVPEPAKSSAPVSSRMMKTKESELHIYPVPRAVKGTADKSGGKKKKKEKTGSDEGSNTVLSIVKAVVYIIFVLVVSIALSIFTISVANDVFAFVKDDEAVQITIPENTTLDELSDILYQNGVIRYPRVFKLYSVAKHDDQLYVPGDYTVSPMMNYSSLLSEFKEKIVIDTVTVTIPEGYTTDDIITLFVDRYGIGTREGFEDVIQNHEFDFWFVKELEENGIPEGRIYRLDGYLFPDTYEFYSNSSELTVVTKLLRRFGQIFSKEYRSVSAELGFTVDQIVTLASMVEKEAAAPSEFFKVASVFLNRLKPYSGFPRLESDATVVYAIQHDTGERTVDLFYETPYNTYQHEGLPPGPIANPSASALLAALTPYETNYYYFVSDNGETFFSETKEEHDQHIDDIRKDILARIQAENPTPVILPPEEGAETEPAEGTGEVSEGGETSAGTEQTPAGLPAGPPEGTPEGTAENPSDQQPQQTWTPPAETPPAETPPVEQPAEEQQTWTPPAETPAGGEGGENAGTGSSGSAPDEWFISGGAGTPAAEWSAGNP